MENNGEIEKVSRGVYVSPDVFEDEMYILGKKRHAIIYSHETALFLHDLTDRDPIAYSVTVPSGYNTKTLCEKGILVHYIKKDLHSIGKIEMPTSFGNKIFAYDMERTICDVLKNKNKMDIAVLTDAVKRYSRKKDKDLNKLMQYAEIFKVTNLVRNYMEVLL
jgi:predicted transcriptional regulator of viral defense system